MTETEFQCRLRELNQACLREQAEVNRLLDENRKNSNDITAQINTLKSALNHNAEESSRLRRMKEDIKIKYEQKKQELAISEPIDNRTRLTQHDGYRLRMMLLKMMHTAPLNFDINVNFKLTDEGLTFRITPRFCKRVA